MHASECIGYVVRLASGGPFMTVEAFNPKTKQCTVSWMDKFNRIQRKNVHGACLRVIRRTP